MSKKRKPASFPAPARLPEPPLLPRPARGKSYALALKLEAVRLVLGEGLSQTATAARLQVTQRCVSHWLELHRLSQLEDRTPPCHLLAPDQWCDYAGLGGFMGHTCRQPTNLQQLHAFRALEAVQAAWRQVFGPSDP
jgi:predicted DNA-binding protein (UPF0251 family)